MSEEISIIEKFGEKIRILRKERSLSQEELPELSGLDRTYISGIERGVRNVTLKNIKTLAQALKIKISDLFEDF